MFLGFTQVSCQNSKENESTEEDVSLNMETEDNEEFLKAKSESEWKKEFTANQFEIMVKKGTEPPFNNAFF